LCAAEVDKLGKVMKQAKAADIHIVDEGFLDDVGKSPASVSQLITQHSIAAWGSDVSLSLHEYLSFFSNCCHRSNT